MKRMLSIVAIGAALAALSSVASAHSNIGFSVSIGVPGYVAPPVAYAPPPVVYAPPPVVYAPAPVYYAPAPRVYYGPPAFGYYYGRPH
ncbi:MAG TPA: hypothetical protein VLN59_03945, partial [Burkholderiales bacterium]|nr:hypothetical protein [Burkholderiales bacterium]